MSKSNISNIVIFLIILIGFTFTNCTNKNVLKRVFYVNSYHKGYGSSDDVMKGIQETFEGKNIKLETCFLDAKRKSSEEEITQSVQVALSLIKEFLPELIIVSDDAAVKHLIVPNFNNTELPVVFCGVNWSAEKYALGSNVTGMLEVLPLRNCISKVLSKYQDAKKLTVLSENSLSEQNNRELLDTLYRNLGLMVSYSLADDFEMWKKMYLEANESADLIYMPTNGAIKNWNENVAKMLIKENIKIPIVTCDDFMMPYVVYGQTKVAKEQGEWAATSALRILEGEKPSEIPFTHNKQTREYVNDTLASIIDFKIDE